MGKEKTLRVFDANLIYLMGSLLFFTVGFTVQQRELYTGLIITQLAVVLLPPFLYLEIRKMNVRQTMRLNRITWRQGLLAALITIFMYPTAVTANLVMLNLLTRIGTIDIPQIPTASSPLQYLRLMLIISVLAGVCEEVFFRGFVLRGYEKLGRRKAVVISAVLFGVFHYNIYNLAGAIVLGLVFGALVIVTDSLYVGIIGHMVNNGFAVTLGYAFNLIGDLLPPEEMEIAEAALGDSLLASLVFFGILALAGLVISAYLYRKLKAGSVEMLFSEDKTGQNDIAAEPGKNDTDVIAFSETDPETIPNKGDSGDLENQGSHKIGRTGEQDRDLQNTVNKMPAGKVQWWEYFPLTGIIPLFLHVMFIQISMLLGRF
ncbi:MAG: type II CAAX endopeptidase family protein [Bacillota bacterium]|nr:type II CAAX endopeptidase family protein [Bacillota bacterium]